MSEKKKIVKGSNVLPDKRLVLIGDKIKKLRIEAGYTSSESFANQYDLSRVHYWRIEKGTNLTMESLLKILDIHHLNLNQFFSDFEQE